MPHGPFRFIHAADFHLQQPLAGIAEVPPHLKDLCLDAAFRAAARVFEAALTEESDFVLLAGNLLDPELTGPRGPLLLVDQCRRLAERGIAVYWAGGETDPPELWPTSIRLPDNVHVFPSGHAETLVHQREGLPLVRIVGTSGRRGGAIEPSDFTPDPTGLFTIAVANGPAEVESLRARGIDYWALGGRPDRQTLFSAPQLAVYAGSPQGRQPGQPGPHGCTSVHVDGQRQVRVMPVTTDVVRFHTERVAIEPSTTRKDLQTRLCQRMQAVIATAPGEDLVVTWTIAGVGPLVGHLRQGGSAGELLDMLRKEFGHASPAAWSASLAVEPSAMLSPEWYEQKTIRGDFLRAVRHYQMEPAASLDLESFLDKDYLAGQSGSELLIRDPAEREWVLCEAALLGVDLLSGEEPQL